MVVLVMAAAFFAAVRLGEDLKLAVLSHHVTRLAKCFFGVPDFQYYALADGIATLLAWCSKNPLDSRPTRTPHNPQQFLFSFSP